MTSTYNLARMNMFLHGIVPENQHLRNGDTLDADWPTGEETDFNMVLMNPPSISMFFKHYNTGRYRSVVEQVSRQADYSIYISRTKQFFSYLNRKESRRILYPSSGVKDFNKNSNYGTGR